MEKHELKSIISSLTLEEKIGMLHGCTLFKTSGVKRLNIPQMVTSDGPMGIRMEFEETKWIQIKNNDDFVSYMPCNSALAATFNTQLAYEAGQVLGEEARGRGKDMILAPGINIHRTPLCGRNFEYMSEDPHLIAQMAVPFIQGIQESDVSACVKHFAVNNQETKRTSVDVSVSDRALFEIYLPAFKAAVRLGNCRSIMGAYNQFRGQFCCHNKFLLQDILRNEWGFDGIVISDWGGVHDTMEAALDGTDIEMSVTDDFDDYYMANPLKEAVLSGKVPMDIIDDKIMHILHVMNDLHMLDGDRKPGTYNQPASREKLLRTAQESVILLKNENNALPLNKKALKKLVLIGDNANRIHANGGGSSEIKALYEISPLLGFKMLLGGNCEVVYEPGYYTRVVGCAWDNSINQEPVENWQADSLKESIINAAKRNVILPDETIDQLNQEYLERAKAAVKDADAVIFIGGQNHDYDLEGQDRDSIKLPYGQDRVIKELLALRPDMIVTMFAGSPVDMTPWQADTSAIVFSYFAGMEGGLALAKVLLGDVNPSGKLPTTFPVSLDDSPAHKMNAFPGTDSVFYKEDIFVGYRYFDTYHVEPAFPFGHGLSYTSFSYGEITTHVEDEDNLRICVTFAVTNTGDRSGSEAVQLYVKPIGSSVSRPQKELRAFTKVDLAPGETQEVQLMLDASAFAYYNEQLACFEAPSGKYELLAASSSRDIRQTAECFLARTYHLDR